MNITTEEINILILESMNRAKQAIRCQNEVYKAMLKVDNPIESLEDGEAYTPIEKRIYKSILDKYELSIDHYIEIGSMLHDSPLKIDEKQLKGYLTKIIKGKDSDITDTELGSISNCRGNLITMCLDFWHIETSYIIFGKTATYGRDDPLTECEITGRRIDWNNNEFLDSLETLATRNLKNK